MFKQHLYWSLRPTLQQQRITGLSQKIRVLRAKRFTVIHSIKFQKQNRNEKQVPRSFKLGFGYGKKTNLDFNKNPEHYVPPSNTYNIQSFVEINKHKQKGFTPRYSREVFFDIWRKLLQWVILMFNRKKILAQDVMKNLEKIKPLNGHYTIEQNQSVLYNFILVFPQN